MARFLGTLALSVCLLTPAGVMKAQDHHDQERHEQARTHEWNQNEDPYWRDYLKEHHKKYRDWDKASKKEQENYWKWRDEHRDHR